MILRENVPLSSLTTLRVGGRARFLVECETTDDVRAALLFAREQKLPWSVLGEGSNVLADDDGYAGVVILMRIQDLIVTNQGDSVLVGAGAGMNWDTLVREVASRELWGIENLAGIPGTVGAAPVQNIGAYGMEVKDTIYEVWAIDASTGEEHKFANNACSFGYRESRFKKEPNLLITSVSFLLKEKGDPRVEYKDLAAAAAQGVKFSSPAGIGDAVRTIRARKFPDLSHVGTAGSFFKNPTVSQEEFAALVQQHPEIPGFPHQHGVKVPLAFVLDKVLNLRGYSEGNISLFENQPLVLVAKSGATATEINTFANSIAARVHNATGIHVEREVRTFPSEK